MPDEKIPSWYLSRQLPLFPLHYCLPDGSCSCGVKAGDEGHSYGKHPLTQHGLHDASSDPKQIEKWLQTFPKANWALRLGNNSKLCCLDVDPRHGGLDSLSKLFPDGLPNTFIVNTGSHGFHIYFLFDPLFARKYKLASQGLPGIEFLAEGQYVVIPNSNHILGSYSIHTEVEVIEIPEKVKQLLRKNIVKEEVEYDLEGDLDSDFSFGYSINEGERNDSLASYAGKLIRQGKNESEVYRQVSFRNREFCNPPLEDREVKSIIRSIGNTHTRNNAHIPTANGHKAPVENKPEKEPESKRFIWKTVTFTEGLRLWGSSEDNWIIQDWLLEATTGFIVAPPQMYKSYFVYHMAHSIATGEPFLGQFPVLKTGSVYCINQEDNPRTFFRRIAQIEGDIPHYNAESEEFSFSYMRHPKIYMPNFDKGMRFDLEDDEMMFAFERDVLKNRFFSDMRLLTIDPFYSIVSADDYYIKAAKRCNILKDWRNKYGISILLIHHSGKSEQKRLRDGILGSQLLNAFAETMHAFGPTSKKERIRVERGNKDYKYPDVAIDFDVNEHHFKASISEIKEEDKPENFEASMTSYNAKKFKTFKVERDEWREWVTQNCVRYANELAKHFGVTSPTAQKNLVRFDIEFDKFQNRLVAKEIPEIYNADMDVKDNGIVDDLEKEGLEVNWEGRGDAQ